MTTGRGCGECGKPVTARRRTCSGACKQKAYRKRNVTNLASVDGVIAAFLALNEEHQKAAAGKIHWLVTARRCSLPGCDNRTQGGNPFCSLDCTLTPGAVALDRDGKPFELPPWMYPPVKEPTRRRGRVCCDS